MPHGTFWSHQRPGPGPPFDLDPRGSAGGRANAPKASELDPGLTCRSRAGGPRSRDARRASCRRPLPGLDHSPSPLLDKSLTKGRTAPLMCSSCNPHQAPLRTLHPDFVFSLRRRGESQVSAEQSGLEAAGRGPLSLFSRFSGSALEPLRLLQSPSGRSG